MRQLPALLAMIVLAAAPGAAQDKGQVGLTLGYPSSAGVVWHATDRVAARVAASYAHSSIETGLAIPAFSDFLPLESTTTSSVVSVQLSGLFYLGRADNVSTFLSPRYTYVHSSADREPDLTGLSGPGDTAHAVGAAFGVQYAANRIFSVFGETGLEYQRHDAGSGSGASKSRTVGTRAGVGVILYFRK